MIVDYIHFIHMVRAPNCTYAVFYNSEKEQGVFLVENVPLKIGMIGEKVFIVPVDVSERAHRLFYFDWNAFSLDRSRLSSLEEATVALLDILSALQ